MPLASRRPPLVVALLTILSPSLLAQQPSTVPPEGPRQNTPAVHALVNARVVTSPGTTLDRATLVVRDGVIVALGRDVQPPPDARVWDLSGKTLYPGLIDAFSDLPADASKGDPALAELVGAKYWNSQVVPQVQGDRIYKPDAELNKKLRAQGVVARLAVPSYGLLKGTSALVGTADDAGIRSILRPNVAQHVQITASRSEERGYPSSPMGAFALVRQALYDARWYADARAAWRKDPTLPRPERNDALEALSGQLASRLPFIIDAPDELYFFRADRIAREFGLNLIVRGSGSEYRRLDEVKASGRPVLLPVAFPRPPNVTAPEAALAVSLEDLMHWDTAPENPARLANAGVSIALVSQGLRDKAMFLAAVRKAVARGLNKADALRALTVTPAKLLGVERTHGTLEAGKAASFVVTDGDLFAERTKVLETWVDGRRFEVVPVPAIDPRGKWRVVFGKIVGVVEIKGEIEKLAGRLTLDAATTQPSTAAAATTEPTSIPASAPATQPARFVDLANVSLRGAQLTATLKGDLIGSPGVVQLSVTLTDEEHGADTWLGQLVRPDGSIERLTASRSGAPGPSTQPAEGEPTTQSTEPTPSEELVPPSELRGGTTQTVTPSTSPTPRGAAQAPARRARPGKPALYEVNYPFGEFGRPAPPKAPPAVLFTNATVWTAGAQGTLKTADVLVRDGKIAAVGNNFRVATVDGMLTIDCQGKHLAPGIIDCHSHMATDGGINESGQSVTAEVRIGDFIDNTDINLYRQLAGGVTTANILHGSANAIGGQNQVIKLRWGEGEERLKLDGAMPGIKFALGENPKRANSDAPGSRYPQSRMGVDQIIRDEFRAAKDYQRQWDEFRRTGRGIPPRRDLELDAIVEILQDKRIIHCHSYRQDEILALIRSADELGFKVHVFQHILEGYKVADAMKRHGASASSFADWWAYKFEVYDAIPYNGALMHNAGLVVSFNSDDPEMARRLNVEAAKAVKYGGVPEEEAIKFVTFNAAKQLRIDDRVGSIEVGKDADLVLWSGPPLSSLSRVEQTWIDGRRYFDVQEDQALREQVRKRRAALVQRALESGEPPAEPDETPRRGREMWPNCDIFCGAHGGQR